SVPTLLVEMLIVEWCEVESGGKNPKLENLNPKQAPNQKTEKKKTMKQQSQGSELASTTPAIAESLPAQAGSEPLSAETVSVTMDAREIWQKILGSLGQYSMALDTILSTARPGAISGDELTVYVAYDFHRQQLMSEKNRAKFEEIL